MTKILFSSFLSDFNAFWDYKPTNAIHADFPCVYTSEKNIDLSTIDNNHLKYDVIDGGVTNGLGEPSIYSFVLNKPPGHKVFYEPDKIHYEKKANPFWILQHFVQKMNKTNKLFPVEKR